MAIADTFEEMSEATIDGYIAEKQEENLHLDFKTIGDASFSKRDDRQNLAEAISGFANSDGGLIVWGVDARPNSEGIDCAHEKRPIADLPRLSSQLNNFTGEAASPVVDGVKHRAIPAVGSRAGFAVTLVPASDSGPHMAKLGVDRYFKRSGSRFVRMEHFDLEDMFGRRQRPVLEVTLRVVSGLSSIVTREGRWDRGIVMGLRNVGRGTARAPLLVVRLPQRWDRYSYGIDGNSNDGLTRVLLSADSGQIAWGGSANLVIHPDVAIDVAVLTGRLVELGGAPSQLDLQCRVAAEGTRLLEGEITITSDELVRGALAKMGDRFGSGGTWTLRPTRRPRASSPAFGSGDG